MNETPQTSSGRRRLIEDILDPFVMVRAMVPTNTSSAFEPKLSSNSLMCSWADAKTLTSHTLSVYVDAAADGSLAASDVRDMIATETLTTPDEPPHAEAYEVPGPNPGEYVFVLDYLGRLTAIAGNCVVHIISSPQTSDFSNLAEPALDIARTVGCSPYVDDFQRPELDTSTAPGGWTTADGWIYDPHTPPAV